MDARRHCQLRLQTLSRPSQVLDSGFDGFRPAGTGKDGLGKNSSNSDFRFCFGFFVQPQVIDAGLAAGDLGRHQGQRQQGPTPARPGPGLQDVGVGLAVRLGREGNSPAPVVVTKTTSPREPVSVAIRRLRKSRLPMSTWRFLCRTKPRPNGEERTIWPPERGTSVPGSAVHPCRSGARVKSKSGTRRPGRWGSGCTP